MKKPKFSSRPGAKVKHQEPSGNARAQPCDHSEKNYKIKNIKDTPVHFAFMRKNSLNGTSFVCRVIYLFLYLFSLDINFFYANVYQ